MVKVAVITGNSAPGLACMNKLLSKVSASSLPEQLSVRGCFSRQGNAAKVRSSLPAEALKNIACYETRLYVDASDMKSLLKALEGVDRALLVTPPFTATAGLPNNATKSINMIQAAKEVGVKRIVHVGSWSVNAPDRLPMMASRFTSTEQYLETEIGDQMEWTVLRGGYFMSNFVHLHAKSIRANDEMSAVPDCKIPSVDVIDIGEAAAALLGGDHDDNYQSDYHKSYIECCGPQLLTHEEIAAELSVGIGRTITYPSPPPKLSDWCAQTENPTLVELYKYMADESSPGDFPFDPARFATVLGREPTPLSKWAADHKHAFGGE